MNKLLLVKKSNLIKNFYVNLTWTYKLLLFSLQIFMFKNNKINKLKIIRVILIN